MFLPHFLALLEHEVLPARSWNTEPQSLTSNIIWWCHSDNTFTEWVEQEANEMMSIELAYSKMSSGSFCLCDWLLQLTTEQQTSPAASAKSQNIFKIPIVTYRLTCKYQIF